MMVGGIPGIPSNPPLNYALTWSIDGLINLEEICLVSDAILIDRGDLSRQVPIEKIPTIQKHIISTANRLETKVYVATNGWVSQHASP